MASVLFGPVVRFVFEKQAERRKAKQHRLDKPEATCHCAVHPFVTADLHGNKGFCHVDDPGCPPSFVHERMVIVHQVSGQGTKWTQVVIGDLLWPEHCPCEVSQRKRHCSYPKNTGSSKIMTPIAFGHGGVFNLSRSQMNTCNKNSGTLLYRDCCLRMGLE